VGPAARDLYDAVSVVEEQGEGVVEADVVVRGGEADPLGGQVAAIARQVDVPRLLHLAQHRLQADVEHWPVVVPHPAHRPARLKKAQKELPRTVSGTTLLS
jgi:hypothetical protein